jgi:hypothetical protein
MHRGSICACVWLAAAAVAGQPENGPLASIKARMAENLARIPNYTCTQSIERWHPGEDCPTCQYLDRLRLEVAVFGGREHFAWPGAGSFEDRDIIELMGGGALFLSDFAGLATGIFVRDRADYVFGGETAIGGRRALRFAYKVAAKDSGFRVRIDQAEGVVGYSGSFWADGETLDLLRLEVQVTEIPAQLNLGEATAVVEYHRVRIGDSDFLLPRTTNSVIVTRRGVKSRNRTVYSACHQYVGESTIHFGESDEATLTPAPAPAGIAASSAPPGLKIHTVLAASVDLSQCAVGDAVTLVVAGSARGGGFRVPKGALLRGRITRFVDRTAPRALTVLGLRVSTLEIGDQRFAFRGRLLDAWGIEGGPHPLKFPLAAEGADALLFIDPGNPQVPKNYHFLWITAPQEKP